MFKSCVYVVDGYVGRLCTSEGLSTARVLENYRVVDKSVFEQLFPRFLNSFFRVFFILFSSIKAGLCALYTVSFTIKTNSI